MDLAAGILLHGFGPRYNLPISLALYLYAAAGVVVISFVLVVLFSGEQVGAKALQYPRRRLQFVVPLARSPVLRMVGGLVGILALFAVVIAGLFGSTDPTRNPAEYGSIRSELENDSGGLPISIPKNRPSRIVGATMRVCLDLRE